MIRNSLLPLEGELVAAAGHYRSASRHGDRLDHLLTNVRVWRWDGEAPLNFDAPADATVDHLWTSLPAGSTKGIELMQTVIMLGRVGWYSRGDGSVDLAIQTIPCFDMDVAWGEIQWHRKKGASDAAALNRLNEMIEVVNNRDGIPFSTAIPVSKAKAILRRTRDRLLRSVTAHCRTLLTAPASGRCKAPRGFRDLMKQAARA